MKEIISLIEEGGKWKAASKREESQARLSSPEREQTRPKVNVERG